MAGPVGQVRGAGRPPGDGGGPGAPSRPRVSRSDATPTSTTRHRRTLHPGQHVDGGPAGDEVGDHLPGDLLRPRRDPLGDHPVIAREDGDRRGPRQRRGLGPGDGGELHTERLELAEGARRLGEPIVVLTGPPRGVLVDRADQGAGGCERAATAR